MKKTLYIMASFSLVFTGCINSSSSAIKINNIPVVKTHVKEEAKVTGVIKEDNHRYDSRYNNFNYNRLGYSNKRGLYYGYYDNQGYFYNNMYFTYDNQYRYEERYNRRGNFDLNSNHIRPYIHHHDNDWNQRHAYREVNQEVGEYPYYEKNLRPRYRVFHPREGVIEYGDLSYQNSQENLENIRE